MDIFYDERDSTHKDKLLRQLDYYDSIISKHLESVNAHKNKARILWDLGRCEDALTRSVMALDDEHDRTDAFTRINNLNHTIDKETLQKQLDFYDYMISKHPENADAHENKARILWDLGRCEEALSCYMIILSINSNDGVLSKTEAVTNVNPNVLCSKGNKFYNQCMFREALLYFEKILETDSINMDALVGKAVSLRELVRYEESIRCIDDILMIWPDYTFASDGRELVLSLIKNNNKRISMYDRHLIDDPKDTDALTCKGVSLNAVGRYTDAVKCFETALEIKPDHVEALEGRTKSFELIRDVCKST